MDRRGGEESRSVKPLNYYRLFIEIATIILAVATLFYLNEQNGIILQQQKELVRQNNSIEQQNVRNIRSTNSSAVSELISDIQFQRVLANQGGLHPDSICKLPSSLSYRIAVLSRSLIPYDTTLSFTTEGHDYFPRDRTILDFILGFNSPEDSIKTSKSILSPERGYLFKILVDTKTKFPLESNPVFSYADLRKVNLRSFNASSCDLEGADFRKNKNLGYIRFIDAYLKFAKFADTDLAHADFSRANLFYSDFRLSNLANANFAGVILYNVNFTNAILGSANFQNAWLYNAKLRGASLMNVDFSRAHLYGADLEGARLYNSKFTKALIDSTYQTVRVMRNGKFESVSFVPYALSKWARILDEDYNLLPDSLQNSWLYR